MSQKTLITVLSAVVVVILIAAGTWFYFSRSSSSPTNTAQTPVDFGNATNNPTTVNPNTSTIVTNQQQPVSETPATTQQKIFEISADPVVGATFIQTFHPTTTLARYISQNNGHVFDLPVDVPGAIPRVVSNVTIPGGVRAVWLEKGQAAIVQYLQGSTVKSVILTFPPASTTTLPTKLHFLPDKIVDLAASPDGNNIVYLLKTSAGVDGYTTTSSGTNVKKLFSLPLAQILISWPAQGTLLAQTNSAAGVLGIAFSIDAKSGSIIPLLSAQGLTATTDKNFTNIIYQTTNDTSRVTYMHTVKNNSDTPLGFSPFPEKCIWSSSVVMTMYCATPLQYADLHYLDLWHGGMISVANSILSFNLQTGVSTVAAVPGSSAGGTQTDILELSLSTDEHYLSYITKGDRTLWGVRLAQ